MDFSEVDLSKLRAKWDESEIYKCSGLTGVTAMHSAIQFAALIVYRCMELADSGAAEKMREEFGL